MENNKDIKKNPLKEKPKTKKGEEEWGEEGKEKDSGESLADMGQDVIDESMGGLGIENTLNFGAESVESMIDRVDILHTEDITLDSGQGSQGFIDSSPNLESVAGSMMSGATSAGTGSDSSANPNKYQNSVRLYNDERNEDERRSDMASGRAVHLNLITPTELVSEGMGQRVFGMPETSGDFRRENFRMMRHNPGAVGGEDMEEGKLYDLKERRDDEIRNPFAERGGDERVRAAKKNYEGRR